MAETSFRRDGSGRRDTRAGLQEGEGQVKLFQQEKGFGFINVAGEERDIFFHITKVTTPNAKSTLTRGTRVRLKYRENDKGLLAEEVTVVED